MLDCSLPPRNCRRVDHWSLVVVVGTLLHVYLKAGQSSPVHSSPVRFSSSTQNPPPKLFAVPCLFVCLLVPYLSKTTSLLLTLFRSLSLTHSLASHRHLRTFFHNGQILRLLRSRFGYLDEPLYDFCRSSSCSSCQQVSCVCLSVAKHVRKSWDGSTREYLTIRWRGRERETNTTSFF